MIVFDPAKDAANIAKHGVSLRLAESMSLDDAIIVPDLRRDYGEERWTAYQLIGGRVHVLVFTVRDRATRPISLRKANDREKRFFESRRGRGSEA
ncbi:MAG: BrnT family toxin [Brevundimonas sp.]|uniref:BrnT family toxin n=1 Tax=Brevundimonas sp. TaxID=1871086 RepID=UPI001A3246D9|nr:BrnT family toxin [Brevundimonas sp.]MBJ7448149.1 BrnT family toxin [Brevundimonas sp.]